MRRQHFLEKRHEYSYHNLRRRSRAKADKVTGEHKSYIFDLDAIDTAEEDLDDAEEYSVDAYHQGMGPSNDCRSTPTH